MTPNYSMIPSYLMIPSYSMINWKYGLKSTVIPPSLMVLFLLGLSNPFQMALCLDSPVEVLVDAIKDKLHGDLETLVNLWVRWLYH